MEKIIKIATAHSENPLSDYGKPREEISLKLQGGSPWFGYLWVDDQCYQVSFGGRNYKFKRIA